MKLVQFPATSNGEIPILLTFYELPLKQLPASAIMNFHFHVHAYYLPVQSNFRNAKTFQKESIYEPKISVFALTVRGAQEVPSFRRRR